MSDPLLQAATERRGALQERLSGCGAPVLRRSGTAKELFQALRSYLFKAYDRDPRLIREPPAYIHQNLLLLGPRDDIATSTHSIAMKAGVNFRRDPTMPHFTRASDGWTFHFQLTVRETKQGVEILAYGFELQAPTEDKAAPFAFVRFDLNAPGHANVEHGLRSHMHLGTDDDGFRAPAPIMDPFELLDLFVFGLRADGRRRRAEHPDQSNSLLD